MTVTVDLTESLFAGLLVLSCCTAMIRKQFTFIAGACLQELKSVGGLTLISERMHVLGRARASPTLASRLEIYRQSNSCFSK